MVGEDFPWDGMYHCKPDRGGKSDTSQPGNMDDGIYIVSGGGRDKGRKRKKCPLHIDMTRLKKKKKAVAHKIKPLFAKHSPDLILICCLHEHTFLDEVFS